MFCGDKAFSCYDGSQLSLWLRIENLTLITSDRKTTTTSTAHSGATAKPHFLWRADGEHKERTHWLTRKGVRNTKTSLIPENSSFSFYVADFLIVWKQSCRYEQKMRDEQLHQFLSLHSNRSNRNQPERQKVPDDVPPALQTVGIRTGYIRLEKCLG